MDSTKNWKMKNKENGFPKLRIHEKQVRDSEMEKSGSNHDEFRVQKAKNGAKYQNRGIGKTLQVTQLI